MEWGKGHFSGGNHPCVENQLKNGSTCNRRGETRGPWKGGNFTKEQKRLLIILSRVFCQIKIERFRGGRPSKESLSRNLLK